MASTMCVTVIMICCVILVTCTFPVALSCDSCGRECASACGTRHFRTCCFNYLKKRNGGNSGVANGDSTIFKIPELKMELWLATKNQIEKDYAKPFFAMLNEKRQEQQELHQQRQQQRQQQQEQQQEQQQQESDVAAVKLATKNLQDDNVDNSRLHLNYDA